MEEQTRCVALGNLGVIAARGPDARRFLQGQVSQDVLAMPLTRVAIAGCHNPQGRTTALLRLVPLDAESVALVLPRERIPDLLASLRRFVLRARVRLVDETAEWILDGLWPAGAAAALASRGLPMPAAEVGALSVGRSGWAWRHAPDGRIVMLTPAAALPGCIDTAPDPALRHWHLAEIAAGWPQVYAATAAAFVAQMLNLDAIDGISFTKGCYTGQEVIARAHYRGRVKRRMQRFVTRAAPAATEAAALLVPGSQWLLQDGRSLRVVDAELRDDGRVELLGVTAVAATGDDQDPDATAAQGSDAVPVAARLSLEPLPLPYELPAP
jgi:folate-binding protein YgfZ